jgi:hypothetical protein
MEENQLEHSFLYSDLWPKYKSKDLADMFVSWISN